MTAKANLELGGLAVDVKSDGRIGGNLAELAATAIGVKAHDPALGIKAAQDDSAQSRKPATSNRCNRRSMEGASARRYGLLKYVQNRAERGEQIVTLESRCIYGSMLGHGRGLS